MSPPPYKTDASATIESETARLPLTPMPGLPIAPPRVVADDYCVRDRTVRRLLALADSMALALALLVAFSGQPNMWSYVSWGLLLVAPWLVICSAYGLYDGDIKRISHGSVDELPGLGHALLIVCLLMWLYYHVVPSGTIHFKHVLMFGLITLVSSVAFRTATRRMIHHLLGPERVLLVGDDDAIGLLAGKLTGHPEYGLEPVGHLSARSDAVRPVPEAISLPWLGDLAELDIGAVVAEHAIHRIVVSHADVRTEDLLEMLHRAQELGVKVAVVPQPFDAMGPSVEVDNVEGLTVFGMYPPVLRRSSRVIKRGMDIVGSLVVLLVGAPVLAAVACAIKVDSRGPVFFSQRRVGRGGRRFLVMKFRTMVQDAEQMVEAMLADSRDPDWLLVDRDPRITRVGRLLRRTSLDELPQAWNVLKGEMSLVGPRPLVESEDSRIRGWGRCRIDLTPGMTGLWQVVGRTNIPFREMVTLDYLYVTNWSLWGDIKLLLSTVPVLLSRRGAN
ncbi:MAG: sugar transferase [Solirubrobacterales bacterium]|jgi:exopolysaccharide biosynthesis polyprenyl glycosylphosphotransferase|nr:sugar transferase [Solirubrobacterales bacterium]